MRQQARLPRGDRRASASSIRRSGEAFAALPRRARRTARHDAQRAALHRRGRAGAQLRTRGGEVLRQPARAVGGDPEARGRAWRGAVRARQERGHASRRSASASSSRRRRCWRRRRASASSRRPAATSSSARCKLGVIYTIAPYLLPDLIPALHGRAPQMPLEIEENLTENLETALTQRPHRRGDHRAAVQPARRAHRVPVRGAVPGRGAARPQVGAAQVDRARRAPRRAHDPAQRRSLLSRPGARRVSRAQSQPTRRSRAPARSRRCATWWPRGSAFRCCRAMR